jgi:hypothetical protein
VFQALTSVQEQTPRADPQDARGHGRVAAAPDAPALQLLRDYAERVFAQLQSFGLN